MSLMNHFKTRTFLYALLLAVHCMAATAKNDSHQADGSKADSTINAEWTQGANPETEIHSKPKPEPIPKKAKGLARVLEGVSNFFMGCDTNYVTPQKYQMTAQTEISYWHDYYFMRSSATGNTMTIQSDPSAILGAYVYYSILGYGMEWNLNDIGIPAGKTNGTSMRQAVMIHTAKIFAEYYRFNSGKGAEIKSVSNMELQGLDMRYSGLNSKCDGVSAVYMFNNKHFSWPAAFGANAVQRKSCGSWSVGFQYNHQKITMDRSALPSSIKNDIDTTLLFSKVDYRDYSISVGYSYNFVLGKNLLLAASIMPSIGYRRSNIKEEQIMKRSILNDLATDINLRMSFFWNNTRAFNGVIFEMHTYDYRKDKFGLTNTYGTLKFMFGVNFWKKPQI